MNIDMTLQTEKLTAIANAIRQRGGTDAPISANDFPDSIRAIKTSGPDLSVPLTVTAKPGASVTAVNGGDTLTATAGDDGLAVLQLTKPGTWTVTAALDDWSNEDTVEVPDGYPERINVFDVAPDGYMQLQYVDFAAGTYVTPGIPRRFTTYRGKLTVELTATPTNRLNFLSAAYSSGKVSNSSSPSGSWYYYDQDYVYYEGGQIKIISHYLRTAYSGDTTAVPAVLPSASGKLKIEWRPEDSAWSVNSAQGDFTSQSGSYGSATGYLGSSAVEAFRFYELIFWKTDGTEQAHIVPCTRDSDGAVGLINVTSGTFYTNTNGTLAAGPAL